MDQVNNTPSPFQLSNITPKNIFAIVDSVYNQIQEEDYIKEQAAERMQKCLDANSRCIRPIYSYTDDNQKVERFIYNSCESCGCHAPGLFYARYKTCTNKDGSIRWTNMLSKEDWELEKLRRATLIDTNSIQTLSTDTDDKVELKTNTKEDNA